MKRVNPEYALRQKGKVKTLALWATSTETSALDAVALQMRTYGRGAYLTSCKRSSRGKILGSGSVGMPFITAPLRLIQNRPLYGLIFALEGDWFYGQSFSTVAAAKKWSEAVTTVPFLKENQFGESGAALLQLATTRTESVRVIDLRR